MTGHLVPSRTTKYGKGHGIVTSAIIPSEGDFVELAGTSKGSLFKKQILRVGESFIHPRNPDMKVDVSPDFAKTLVDNFESGVGGIVQFPFVDAKNRHIESPDANRGEVVGLSYDDKGVYATIDVRRDAEHIGSTVLGASAMLDLDYQDKKEGKKHGPTLLHVAATNRPYLTDLAPYEQVALSDDSSEENLVVLSRVDESEPVMPTLDELYGTLKSEHGVDVPALQAQVEALQASDSTGELVAALSGVLTAADSSLVALSDADEDDLSIEDVAQGVVELSRNYADQFERLQAMESEKAESEVDALVAQGRILPAQREAMLKIRLSDVETFESIVPEESIVSLSEYGVTSHQRPAGEDEGAASSETERYLNMHQSS